jgi:hypothetical protein
MGFLAFCVFALIVVCAAYFFVWVAAKLAPTHPSIVDNLIWVLAVGIIVFELAGALGLHDVAIPRVFGH